MAHLSAVMIGLMLLALPVGVAAQSRTCPEGLATLIRSAFPAAHADGAGFILDGQHIAPPGAPYGPVCRRWPARPELLLVAVLRMNDAPDPAGYDVTADLDIMIFEDDGAPVARLSLPQFVRDDAITLQELTFDTARYRLVEGRLAFGLRARVANASRVNPFSQTRLWLFDLQGGGLVPVLEGMVVAQSAGEWDSPCEGALDSLTRYLSLSDTTQNGGTDLLITTATEQIIAQPSGEDCDERRLSQAHAETLRFDGIRYPLPQALLGGED